MVDEGEGMAKFIPVERVVMAPGVSKGATYGNHSDQCGHPAAMPPVLRRPLEASRSGAHVSTPSNRETAREARKRGLEASDKRVQTGRPAGEARGNTFAFASNLRE